MTKRILLKIHGRVQGVCFRTYAQETAERLGLTGWVRNCRDGSVEALAEGEEKDLKEFTAWCRQGPSYAHVTAVETEEADATGEFSDFQVTY